MLIWGMSLQKDREELIRHFKDNMSEPSDDDLRKIEELQENYKDKSDDEIFLEICKPCMKRKCPMVDVEGSCNGCSWEECEWNDRNKFWTL